MGHHYTMTSIIELSDKHIHAFGINHQNAPAAIREQVAFTPEAIEALLAQACVDLGLEELAILSTCNRSEWYAIGTQAVDFAPWLARQKALPLRDIQRYAFHVSDREAIRHIFRVACGLDSLILGEPQILGQMKQAYRLAKEAHTVRSALDRLFQQAFSVAKQVRHHTEIGVHPVSVAYAGVKLSHQFFNDHPQRSALVVGAGETGRLTAKYLRDAKIGRLMIANRSLERAQVLAQELGGFALSLSQIPQHLHEADLVFGTARCDAPLIDVVTAQKALRQRRSVQVYVDLGIPRNFDVRLEQLDELFLYGVDDLQQMVDHNVQARRDAASQAEIMVNLYSDDFLGWFLSKPQQQLVRHMREEAHAIRQQLLQEALRRIELGEPSAQVLEQFSVKLSNKLLHAPSAFIQAIPHDHKDWLAIAQDVFHKN